MWFSQSEVADRTEIRVTENGKNKQRDDDESATGDVDSGFLSGGNMQFSEEIDNLRLQRTGRANREGDKGGWIYAPTVSVVKTTISPSPVAKEPINAVDSGVVDADLSETLSELSLNRISMNTVDATESQNESMTLELLPVSADSTTNRINAPQHPDNDDNDVVPSKQQRRDNDDEKRALRDKDLWQLCYAQNEDGDTQLHIAIMQGYVEAALAMIRLRPHPCLLNIFNDDWQSPLYLAVLTNQPLIVRHLILAGANPSLRNFRGDTALHLACANGNYACAKALTDPLSPMERNRLMPGQEVPALPQNLEQRNYSGEMCLHVAAANGHVNVMRLLLRLGADLEAREALAGRTALHLAMECGHWAVVNFLLQECKPRMDTRTYGGLTAYQLALCIDAHLARELLRYGARPEPLPESDSEGNSANDSDSGNDDDEEETSFSPAYINVQNTVGIRAWTEVHNDKRPIDPLNGSGQRTFVE